MEQYIVFGTLIAALVLFIDGRLRYDMVALLALLTLVVMGIVPAGEAFNGFGHPAVITVAAVLVISRGLLNAGLVDVIARSLSGTGKNPVAQVAVLTGAVALCSGFMNNVGALALLLPVAIRMARKSELPPSVVLMPLAFGSLLGGMTTLIGTPPNIIVSAFRAQAKGSGFGMFDYTPVGLGVAVAGIAFIALVGWRLLPQRKPQALQSDLFKVEDYLTEVRVSEKSPLVGKTLRELPNIVKVDVLVVALERSNRRVIAPSGFEVVRADDVLTVETEPDQLKELVEAGGLELVGSEHIAPEALASGEISVLEVVVAPGSMLRNRTAVSLNLRWRHGVNLLAVSRQGVRLRQRLGQIRFRVGDVLLIQAASAGLSDTLADLGCLPLADRELQIGKPRRLVMGLSIFGGAIALSVAELLPIQVSLMIAVVAMILLTLLTLREAYESIDWPIIVLLGAMIPVGEALETSGGAQTLANLILSFGSQVPPVITLVVILVGTMFLSDVVNNAAAALLMSPIALTIARALGVNADPFLLAVAIGASCAFLTPIGHQSNTIIMGPGGYKFGDYWRMGLPLEVIVVLVSVPLLLLFWPL